MEDSNYIERDVQYSSRLANPDLEAATEEEEGEVAKDPLISMEFAFVVIILMLAVCIPSFYYKYVILKLVLRNR
jgi:hypothetical protein